jgi:peptide/nickel transport system permease protein
MSESLIAVARPAASELMAGGAWRVAWRRLRLNSVFIAGVLMLLMVIAGALAAPLLTPYDPIAQDLNSAFLPPLSPGHPLGTDNFGRDIWSRIIYGAQLDLQIAFLAVLFPFLFGSLLGVITGFFGGKIDLIVMRLVDILMSFPFLILVIAIMSLLGTGLRNFYIAIGIVGWIPYARLVRGETLATRNLEYVQAATVVGCTKTRIILRHVLVNCIQPALIYVFTGMVLAVMTGATLSFLGLGVQPPTPEWGAMIALGRTKFYQWWLATFPGLAILSVILACNLLGEGLRNWLDPNY